MTTWYLWAVNDDPRTNECLVKIIGEGNEENLYPNKLCADGERRNLFRCPRGYRNVRSALSALAPFNLKIEVFKEEIEDVIVLYNLWKKTMQKKAQAKRAIFASRRRRSRKGSP